MIDAFSTNSRPSRAALQSGSLAVAALLIVLLGSTTAEAYPQYAGRSEFSCSDCHYSPTGGGLVNEWGRDSREISFGKDDNPSQWWGHDDAIGRDKSENAELQFDVGAEARTLFIFNPAVVFVPMLMEVGAVAALSDFTAYGSLGGRKGPPGQALLAFSREHWLMYSFNDRLSLRAGRIALPFGLRLSDHTQYAREDFGFDRYDQSYAVEANWINFDISVSAAAFVGDLLYDNTDLRESGGVLRARYVYDNRVELGLSGLVSDSSARDRLAGAASLRWNMVDDAYLLGEFALQRYGAKRSDAELQTSALFLRAGYFVLPELDAFLEFGQRQVKDESELAKWRIGAGANWQAWHWLEVIPQLHAENQKELGTEFAGLLQAHLMY